MEGPLRLLVPLHVTGFWRVHVAGTLRETGSTGAGLVLGPAVEAVVSRGGAGFSAYLNGRRVDDVCVFRAVARRLRALGPSGTVRLRSGVPLGAGFALSAALAIASACGAYWLSTGRLPLLEALAVAHESEVECGTGLGDVIAAYHGGGLEVRVKPGAPGVGEVLRVPLSGSLRVIAAVVGRRMDTSTMLARYRDRVNLYGGRALERLLEDPSLERFLELSLEFSVRTGMLDEALRSKLGFLDEAVRRGSALGYYLKKNVLVVVAERGDVAELEEELSGRLGWSTYKLRVSNEGLRVSARDGP